jgi:hypothetical protein
MWSNRRFLIAAAIGVAALAIVAGRLTDAPAPPRTLAHLIHGTRPSYAPERVAAVPNEAAITLRFWAPDLDDFYNPQGLAVIDGAVLVAAYRSEAEERRRGPCRVFRLDPGGGPIMGRLDVPKPCGHAGGLAVADDGMLYVADTHTLFATLLRQAFSDRALPFHGVALGPGLTGALAASAQGAIWIGTYREDGDGSLFRFAADVLARPRLGEMLTISEASRTLAIPSHAQGAAIDSGGKLWVARSGWRWGELVRLDPASGAIERRYAVAPGIEGIAFDRQGLLWAVSEAGARHSWDHFLPRLAAPFFPLVFALDPKRLE